MENWLTISEIVDLLAPVNDVTIAIQREDFTLSELYCCWLRIHVRLQRLKKTDETTDLCSLLIEYLEKRKTSLLKHPAMLCAIFIDPRIHKELMMNDGTELEIAKLTLTSLNERIQNLKARTEHDSSKKSNTNDSLEEYFLQNVPPHNDDQQHRRTQFIESLNHFHRSVDCMKMEQGEKIIDFWEKQKFIFPELYEVACAINSIPPSQATVERGFSTLKIVFSELRCKLGQEKLEYILMIKLNADLIDQINQSDIEEIKAKYRHLDDNKLS